MSGRPWTLVLETARDCAGVGFVVACDCGRILAAGVFENHRSCVLRRRRPLARLSAARRTEEAARFVYLFLAR